MIDRYHLFDQQDAVDSAFRQSPYLIRTDMSRVRPSRPRTEGAATRPARAQSASPRVSKTVALYADAGVPQKVPNGSPLRNAARCSSPSKQREWGEYAVSKDKVVDDLREAKKQILEYRSEIVQLRAENSRLENSMREQERQILKMSESNGSSSARDASDTARRALEKSMLVRQLKMQINQLRQEFSVTEAELKNLQGKTAAHTLAELSAEKEEYYFETLRLRQIIVSLRQDMAAEIMHRNIAQSSMRSSTEVERELRQELSRLSIGFQDILFELSARSSESQKSAIEAHSSSSRQILETPLSKFLEDDGAEEPLLLRPALTNPREDSLLLVNPFNAEKEQPDFESLTYTSKSLQYSPVGERGLPAARGISEEKDGSASPAKRTSFDLDSPTPSRKLSASTAADNEKSKEVASANTRRGSEPKKKLPIPTSGPINRTTKTHRVEPTAQEPEKLRSKLASAPEPASGLQPEPVPAAVAPEPIANAVSSKMDEKTKVFLVQQMRDTFRRLLMDGAFKIDDLFNHLDEDGDGELTAEEIFDGLNSVPGFEEVTRNQVQALVSSLDDDDNGWISMDEFKKFVVTEKKCVSALVHEKRKTGRKKERKPRVSAFAKAHQLRENASPAEFAKGVRLTFKKTVQDGFSLDELFKEMDADGDGQISGDELQAILVRFRYFKNVTVQQVTELLVLIDDDGAGDVSIEEFKQFLDAEETFAAAIVIQMLFRRKFPNKFRFVKRKSMEIKRMKNDIRGGLSFYPDETFVRKARHCFRQLVKTGLPLEELFNRIDLNHDGSLSLDELYSALSKESTFRSLNKSDVDKLMKVIDGDGDGSVSVSEFSDFVLNEKRHAAATALQAQVRRRAKKAKEVRNAAACADKSSKPAVAVPASPGKQKETDLLEIHDGEETEDKNAAAKDSAVVELDADSGAYSDDFEA